MPLFPLVLLLYLNVICNLLIFLLYTSYLVPTYDIDTVVVVFSSCSSCSCSSFVFLFLVASVSADSPALTVLFDVVLCQQINFYFFFYFKLCFSFISEALTRETKLK